MITSGGNQFTQEDINRIMYRAGQASVIDYIKSIEEDEI